MSFDMISSFVITTVIIKARDTDDANMIFQGILADSERPIPALA
jgi:hypothetical protein